jgi:hypothetical protein
MSVYKELLYAIRDVQTSSRRIYPDAADFGAPVKDKHDRLFSLLRQMKEQYDGKVEEHKYATGATQKLTVRGCDEWGDRGEFDVTFTYVTTRGRKDMIGYVYVDVKPLD